MKLKPIFCLAYKDVGTPGTKGGRVSADIIRWKTRKKGEKYLKAKPELATFLHVVEYPEPKAA